MKLHRPSFFRKRRLLGSLREPTLNLVYRGTGLIALLGFVTAGILAYLFPSTFPVPYVYIFVAAAFGGVVLLTGLTSTEVWSSAISRWQSAVSASPYHQRKLTLLTAFLASAILLVVVAFLFLL